MRYIGIALDDAEEARMRAMGNEFIERATAEDLNQDSLLAVDSVSGRRAGRPARQSMASVAAASSVALTDVEEVSHPVEGPHEELALATNEDGLPIGYELFAGNTAEVSTLVKCMQDWAGTLKIDKVSFVADRALCSTANLALLEQQKLSYIVAMPLRRSLKAAEQAQILQTQLAVPHEVEGDLLWVREFEWMGPSRDRDLFLQTRPQRPGRPASAD